MQVNKEISRIAPKLKVISVYGGHPVTSQGAKAKFASLRCSNPLSVAKNLAKHVDIVVGTPGRVLHFVKDKTIRLQQIQAFVLDEADQMLDTGLICQYYVSN